MRKYELMPTEVNLIDALLCDTIDRNKDIVYFYNVLQAQKTASTIAIDGRWGSGKTFFVRQTKMVINALNPSSNISEIDKENITRNLPLTGEEGDFENFSVAIYYDAWENDNDTDPVLSIIYEIAKQLSIDFSLSDKNIFSVAGAIVESISGRNVNRILEALNSEDPFTKLEKQKDIEENIKEFFDDILVERGNRLIIFIDELDRCKPAFAVHLFEQIKHYIYDDRITFVFSVNLEQLQHTIKHYYGANFDSCRYMDRFFDFRIDLPLANMDKFYNQIGLASNYFNEKIIRRIIKISNFELREITRFYSQVRSAVDVQKRESGKYDFSFPDGKGREIILSCIVPLLIGLRIVDITKYEEFISGKNGDPLKELLVADEVSHILQPMLNGDESFSKEVGKNVVTPVEIVEKFYNAIFVNKYDNRTYHIILGAYEFTKESNEFALRVSNMMSNYADLS